MCSNGASTAIARTSGKESHPVLIVWLAVVPVVTSVSGMRCVAAWCVAHCVAVVETPVPIPTTTPSRLDGSVCDETADWRLEWMCLVAIFVVVLTIPACSRGGGFRTLSVWFHCRARSGAVSLGVAVALRRVLPTVTFRLAGRQGG